MLTTQVVREKFVKRRVSPPATLLSTHHRPALTLAVIAGFLPSEKVGVPAASDIDVVALSFERRAQAGGSFGGWFGSEASRHGFGTKTGEVLVHILAECGTTSRACRPAVPAAPVAKP